MCYAQYLIAFQYDNLQVQKRELFEENQKLRLELDRSSGTIVTEFEREREEWRKRCAALIQQRDAIVAQVERERANWKQERGEVLRKKEQEARKMEEAKEKELVDWESRRTEVL